MFASKVKTPQVGPASLNKAAGAHVSATTQLAGDEREPAQHDPPGQMPRWDFGKVKIWNDTPPRPPTLPPTPAHTSGSLIMGALNSPAETQADRLADRVLGSAAPSPGPEKSAPASQFRVNTGTPPAIYQPLSTPGHPLGAAERSYFEPRFGRDLSRVRVHFDEQAATAAQSVNALAYAAGSRIVFARGQYAPDTVQGRRLLTHELAHVVEHGQSSGGSTVVLRTPAPGTAIKFSLSIDRVYDNDDLLMIEFIKQYRNVSTDAEAIALRDKEHWHWGGTLPKITDADVKKKYILITVEDSAIQPAAPGQQKERAEHFKTLPKEQQQAINEEADKEFWDKSHYKVGAKLGASADDKKMADTWKLVRGELIAKQEAIAALPPDMQKFLFDEQAPTTLSPADYETALRIAQKVAVLSTADLSEYKSRTTSKTADWKVYEASLDRFLAEHKERVDTAKERDKVQTRLYGIEALYDRYRLYVSMLTTSSIAAGLGASSPQSAGMGLGTLSASERIRQELEADLIKAGFPGGIADLEKLIKSYEALFEKETLTLANTMLEQYEHVLWVQQQQYATPAASQALYQSLSQNQAGKEYEQADKIRSDHAQMPMTPDEMAEQSYWVGQRNEALARGDQKVRSGAASAGAGNPLVNNSDFDREALARAGSQSEVQSILMGYIAARQKDIATTRQNLADKPTMIYGLDKLLEVAFKKLNVTGAPIYGKIVRNHISDVHWTEAIPKLIVAVIAVGAGLLSAGTGTVAVLAAGAALGIGAAQALETYHDYESGSAAAGAQLLSESPSFAWVIVALVGAGIDLAVLGATIKASLQAMKPAIETFNAGGSVEKLGQDLEALEKLSKIDATMRANVMRAAAAQAKYRQSLKEALGAAMNLHGMLGGGAGLSEMANLVYGAARRGAVAFDEFVLEMKAAKLLDESAISLEDMARFKSLFEEAKVAATEIEQAGKALSLSDEQVQAFLRIWSKTPGMTLDQLKLQMKAWEATKQGGLPSLALGKNSMIVDENATIAMGKQASGATLQPGEEALVKRMEDFKGSDLRVPEVVSAKGGTSLETFEITVARDSKEYKGVMAELDRVAVGKAKGVEDRGIVCDAFFAKTEPGVTPTLATHDGGIYKKLYLLTGKDPQKLGKTITEALPNGFDVTVKGRTIHVLPLPNKP